MRIDLAEQYLKDQWESRREMQALKWKLGDADPKDVRFLSDQFVKHAIENLRKAKEENKGIYF